MSAPDPPREADDFVAAARTFTWRPPIVRPALPNTTPSRPERTYRLPDVLPRRVDLRTRGLLSPAKHQHVTNACTSFAIAAAAEAAIYAASRTRILLAPWYIHTCLFNAASNEGIPLDDALHAVTSRGIARTTDSNALWVSNQCTKAVLQRLGGSTLVRDELAAKQALAAEHVVVCVALIDWADFRYLPKGKVYRYRPTISSPSH